MRQGPIKGRLIYTSHFNLFIMLNLQGRRPKVKQSLFSGLILEPITTFLWSMVAMLVRAACVRCHGTKCPLLTTFFFSFFLLLHLLFSQKGLSNGSEILHGLLVHKRNKSEDPHRRQWKFFGASVNKFTPNRSFFVI